MDQQQQSARLEHLFFSCSCHLSQAFCLALSHIAGSGFSVDGFSALHVHSFYFSKVAQVLLERTANHTPPRSFLRKTKSGHLTFRRLSALLFIHVVPSPGAFSSFFSSAVIIIFVISHQRPFSAVLRPFDSQRNISSGLCDSIEQVPCMGRSW